MLALCSLWGAPGVTTVAYRVASALTGSLGRTVLMAECDHSGGDLAVRLAMSASPGMATLAVAARRELSVEDIWEHVQEAPSGVGLLLGLTSAEHGRGFGAMWGTCAQAIASVRALDVLVDVGRLEPGMAMSRCFIEGARSVLVCARPEAASLVHTARRIDTLREANPDVRLILVGNGPYGQREACEATGAEVIGSVGEDPTDRDWMDLASTLADSVLGVPRPSGPSGRSCFPEPVEHRVLSEPSEPGVSRIQSPANPGAALEAVSIHEVRARIRAGSGNR